MIKDCIHRVIILDNSDVRTRTNYIPSCNKDDIKNSEFYPENLGYFNNLSIKETAEAEVIFYINDKDKITKVYKDRYNYSIEQLEEKFNQLINLRKENKNG